MNYYPHHLGDYMRDTAQLSILEDGVYRRLLDAYYVHERPLPTELGECCKIARAASRRERNAVAYVLKEFFQLCDDGYHQRRADSEIERFRQKSAKAKVSSLLGVMARRSNTARSTERMTERSTEGVTYPITSNQKPITKSQESEMRGAAMPPDACPEFEVFKEIYPKRAGGHRWGEAKKNAKARIREGYTWQQILDGAQRYRDFCRHTGKERTEYVRGAAKFLNDEKDFLDPWDLPATKADARLKSNLSAADEFMRRTEAAQ